MDHTGGPTDCNDVTQTLLREYRYDAPRQRYLEREWQPKDYPVTDWLQDIYGGKEYAGTSAVKLNWEDAKTAAEAYDAHLATAEDSFEWYRLDGFWGLGGSVYLGGFQDPNSGAPEPLGGWTWISPGAPGFAPWCDPNNIGPGNPPWDYHEEEDPPPGGDPNEPEYYSDITVQPDDVPAGADYLKMNFASGQPFGEGNWYDSAGTGEEGYIIERPLFVKDEWHDYDGNAIYADWSVDLGKKHPTTGAFLPEAIPLRSHLAGVSFVDVTDPNPGAPGFTRYFHNNHLGTTAALTDASGTRTDLFFYSAFGVKVGHTGSTETRYGYVGAEGYQTDTTTRLMHLGARYYDATIGRFLQRDPIGVRGGFNVYSYANNPTTSVDPTGLDRWYVQDGLHGYVIVDNPDADEDDKLKHFRFDFYNDTNDKGLLFDGGMAQLVPSGPCKVKGANHIPSTPDQDRKCIRKARELEKNPPWYNTILQNCNHIADQVFVAGLGSVAQGSGWPLP